MSNIDFSELIVSKKGVLLSDRQVVGNIIGEKDDSIIVEKDQVSENVYIIPKSKIEGYDGTQLTLKSTESELRTFEQKRESHGESVLDRITDKLGDVKDKAVDTTRGIAGKTKDTINPSSSGNDRSYSAGGGDRKYEEGEAGTDINRKDDPLTEYRDKEPMTPAKINQGEPTAVQRDSHDQQITSEGETGTSTPEAQEQYRKRGMTKVDTESSDNTTTQNSSTY
jgi:hypothetical protein